MQQVAMLADVEEDRGTEIKLGDQTLLLVRDGATVRAFEGKCPHAGAPLAAGAICNGKIVCPWHKSAFAVSDGALLEPPALSGLASFRTEIRDGAIFVDPVRRDWVIPAPRPDDRHVAVLGAGAAGAACVAGLREFGFGGRITMIGAEADEPYDRTALSKFVLEGGQAPDDVAPLLPAGFYADHRIERIQGDVAGLDPAARRVSLGDGRTLDVTAAVIATGSAPKRAQIPGADLGGVFTLRSRADAARIMQSAKRGGRAVLVGSSFIALECASALRKHGMEVSVVTPDAIPFVKQFGPEIGASFRRLHEKNGVRFLSGTTVARLEGNGGVERAILASGKDIPADIVLFGIGVTPVTGFVEGLALAENGGIEVDGGLQAAPGVYAVGDVAHFPRDGGAVRIEHWRLAQQHARVAARNIAGGQARYDGVPFFWTYHFGQRFEYLGHAEHWDEVIIEGTLDEQDFVALLVAGGRVAAIVACQRERATCLLLERMRAGLTAEDARSVIRSA